MRNTQHGVKIIYRTIMIGTRGASMTGIPKIAHTYFRKQKICCLYSLLRWFSIISSIFSRILRLEFRFRRRSPMKPSHNIGYTVFFQICQLLVFTHHTTYFVHQIVMNEKKIKNERINTLNVCAQRLSSSFFHFSFLLLLLLFCLSIYRWNSMVFKMFFI